MLRDDTDEKKVNRINKVISNSNTILNVKTPEITLEDVTKVEGKKEVEKDNIPKATAAEIWGS